MPASAPLTGIVLLNMGGPDTLSDIRPFLARLFSDRELIRLPLAPLTQAVFAWIVSGVRARKVRKYYEEIGGGSPINMLTGKQRDALEGALRETGGNFRVYVGMRYWHPLAKHAVLEMKDDGVARGIALPLYPQYCAATTGSSLSDLRRWMRWAGADFPMVEVKSWPDDARYIAALCERIAETLQVRSAEGTHLLFSAHGVPKSFIDGGDPYQAETEKTVAAVMERFSGIPHSISYQSRLGRTKWLKPDTVDEVIRLGREGVQRLLVVPVSFVSDHIETLHELDIRLRETAREAGISEFLRVPALNDSPAFIRALRDIVLSAAGQWKREREGP
ncbi:MAG TPA: ferrochelatase [Candidatus Deferrimicrobiaceae bacterium]|nr:ferrochelatase [Candidatus Deferrimicrobiaceae bacterium]